MHTVRKILFRILNYILFPVVKLYWRIFQPVTVGVKVLIRHGENVLFLQHSYGLRSWGLPGGGIKKGESPEDAAKREVTEETGITLQTLEYKGSFLYTGAGKKNTIHVFVASINTHVVHIDGLEIDAYSWEKIDSLTLTESPVAKKCFEIAGYSLS